MVGATGGPTEPIPDGGSGSPHSHTASLETGPINIAGSASFADLGVGASLGPYRLLSVLGEGGFGVVYLAERRVPMQLRVAIKVIKPGMDSKAVIARFEQERQALAVLEHPNVTRVLDAGITDRGLPYFVMEYVKGDSITSYCDRERLTLRQRLELFIPVCESVLHAHMKGIIHRDLKPSNILVELIDGRAVPKVIDFGVAKAVSQSLTEKTIFTEHGQMVGTPEYMSPEQADPGSIDVDTRTDVYSLGVILYELLSGSLPFDPKSLRSKGHAEIQRIIREEEPPRPSTKLSTADAATGAAIAKARHADREGIEGELRRELEWIPLKALRKDRARRYATPGDLAADIRRYLQNEPIEAAPESAAYRWRKFAKRRRGALLAASIACGALLLGLAGTLWQARVAIAGRNEAERLRGIALEKADAEARARKRAETVLAFVEESLRSADPFHAGGASDTTIMAALGSASRDIRSGRFADDPETEARLVGTIGTILANNGKVTEALPLLEQAEASYRRVVKGDDPVVAKTLNELAAAHLILGHEALAERKAQEGLEMSRRLGDELQLATALNNVAALHQSAGRWAEAERAFTQALELNQRLIPGDSVGSARSLNNLGVAQQRQGHLAEAATSFARSVEMSRRLGANDHPGVVNGLVNSAAAAAAQGRLPDAERLYGEALAMNRRLFAGDHPGTAVCLNGLAGVRAKLGRGEDAENTALEALEMSRRLYPGDHVAVADSLSTVGGIRRILRRYAEAETCDRQSLEMYQRLCKGDHPAVIASMENLTMDLLFLERLPDAEQLIIQSLEMTKRLHPGDRAEVAAGMNSLARIRLLLQRSTEALPLSEEAVAMARRVLPPQAPEHQKYAETLARCRAAAARSTPQATPP